MADLFEGAPPEWLNAFGEQANDFLDNRVFDWIYTTAKSNRPPEWVNIAGEKTYQTLSGVFGGQKQQAPMYQAPKPYYRQVAQKPAPSQYLRASVNQQPPFVNGT